MFEDQLAKLLGNSVNKANFLGLVSAGARILNVTLFCGC